MFLVCFAGYVTNLRFTCHSNIISQAPPLSATKMVEVTKATKCLAVGRAITSKSYARLCCVILFQPIHSPHSLSKSYSRVDPAQEIARLRHSICLLESHIFPAHRPPPQQRRQTEASDLVPKKEIIDPDIVKHQVPGILGNPGHGLSQGLYAGPTSAATHLLVVFFFPVFLPLSYGISNQAAR